MPASCDIERWMVSIPRAWTIPATALTRAKDGFPSSFETTSMSCQRTPVESPMALINASLAANRPASECSGRPRSAGVKSRTSSAGVREAARSNRARSTISTPMPVIIGEARLFDRHRLGQVAWLVNVESLRRGELEGEDVQRHDGQQRLEERRRERNRDDLVGERQYRSIALLGDCDYSRAARTDLLD